MATRKKKKAKPKRPKAGRPSKIVDENGIVFADVKEKVEQAASVMATPTEIGHHIGASRRTIERWMANQEFRETWERGRALGRLSLRVMLHQAAKQGSVPAMIFLAKQRDILGYTDHVVQEHALPNGPLTQTQVVVQYVNKPQIGVEEEDDEQPRIKPGSNPLGTAGTAYGAD